MNLYTNNKSRGDFFLNMFSEHARTPCQVSIAVAFLTDAEPILELARRGCRVRLIVRLGYPTSPAALRKLIGKEGIQVRYINNHSFHPKLYVFEDRCAIVGSANLTQSALTSNQEVGVAIATDDPRYEELVWLFSEYWAQVRVLDDSDALRSYERLYGKYATARRDLDRFEKETAEIADTRIDNIERGSRKADARDVYLEGYRATYQEFLDAFRTVEKVYAATGVRKVAEKVFPLRLEIDSFLSWVRDTHTRGDSYLQAPILHGSDLEGRIQATIAEWLPAYYRWFEEEMVPVRYPRILRILGSKASIERATYDEIIEALSCENSFYDRLRFFPGGHDSHVQAFMEMNPLPKVKSTLAFLLYGKEDAVSRMGRCIFDPEYKLHHFGRSAVQELLGWINAENLPICNSRTLKSLRWLGFNVPLVDG